MNTNSTQPENLVFAKSRRLPAITTVAIFVVLLFNLCLQAVPPYPRSALEWYQLGYTTNGNYLIDPDSTGTPVSVPCIMSLSGGGWTQLNSAVAATTLNTS